MTHNYLPIVCIDKNSCGHDSMNIRLPKIIQKLIEGLNKYHDTIKQDDMKKDFSKIIEKVEKVLYHLVNKKEFEDINDDLWENNIWNNSITNVYTINNDMKKSWINCSFLFSECYYYRKIYQVFRQSQYYKLYDYFSNIKEQSLYAVDNCIGAHATYIVKLLENITLDEYIKNNISYFLLFSIFCNKIDLSLSAGEQYANDVYNEILEACSNMNNPDIIVNDLEKLFNYLSSYTKTSKTIHIVLDNFGIEFFSDICLSLCFLCSGIADKVIFHTKYYPWFVSDVTQNDITCMLEYLKNSHNQSCNYIYNKLTTYISSHKIEFIDDISWNFHLHYSDLDKKYPKFKNILNDFESSKLVIFKGDMNFRRLTGDYNYDFRTSFKESLGDFVNFPLLALRVIKSDVVVGLSEENFQKTTTFDSNWRQSGSKAMICFSCT